MLRPGPRSNLMNRHVGQTFVGVIIFAFFIPAHAQQNNTDLLAAGANVPKAETELAEANPHYCLEIRVANCGMP